MKARMVIRDTDRGAKDLEKMIKASARGKGLKLHVGILGDNAGKIHEPEPGQKASEITMAALGEIFEFGLGNNPERSWLRNYVDENAERLNEMFKRVAEQVLQKKMTHEQGLELIGLQVVGEVKARVQSGIAPALAASTLRRKGPNKTTPLIFTAQWVGSINHKVE